jgi:hypothetical protein
MGTFANNVVVENASGIVFQGGTINFTPGDTNYDTGDVTSLSNGQVGSFWVSNTLGEVYLSRSAGATTILTIVAV